MSRWPTGAGRQHRCCSTPLADRLRLTSPTANVADPVLQNFCLTAIVIGVAVTAVFLTVAVRVAQHYRSDRHSLAPATRFLTDPALAALDITAADPPAPPPRRTLTTARVSLPTLDDLWA